MDEQFIDNPLEQETETYSYPEGQFKKEVTPKTGINQETQIKQVVTDKELEGILSKQKATIKVIGTGGAGNNTINRISEVGVTGADIVAINTDAQDLLYTTADKKILIGKETTKGMGAGSIPKIGEEAARESEREIKEAIMGADMVFITCGLGGGTGTGSAPIVAEVAKKAGALTVGIVTLPFGMEGQRRYDNAMYGLERLESIVDTLIVIPNDKLLELAPDLPLQTSFRVADEILTNAVKGIAELVTKAGLINLDFADIRTVMNNGGVALIGLGESDTTDRAVEAVEKAITNPLLDVDIGGATGALINVTGGPDMSLEEARKVVETISEKIDPEARLIWGAQIMEDLQNTIRVMLIVTGVKSSQIFGPGSGVSEKRKKDIEDELGIEFVD
uniref:Cell division protein FtsZ n=1 Tax=uncultured marine group II/III euryarchaeote KM3_139_C07 TaxID=1457870 RepID=A0A075GFL1_9EURY|nr:cell division protein (ftsZ) [uncultured marine group II/III euryarchaeote KM3_139_C07]